MSCASCWSARSGDALLVLGGERGGKCEGSKRDRESHRRLRRGCAEVYDAEREGVKILETGRRAIGLGHSEFELAVGCIGCALDVGN